MDEIDEKVQALIEAVKRSADYQLYLSLETELNKEVELKKRVDAFRKRSYELQESETDWFEAADRVAEEFPEIQKIPAVQAYLEAEISVCKRMQNIMEKLSEEVKITEPKI